MTAKTIAFKSPVKAANQWVESREGKAITPAGPTKRLTVDIDGDLHRRIKIDCAGRGLQISDLVRELLIEKFPKPAGPDATDLTPRP
ncbi:MAG: plasmid partition protein ParG [Hyphomicrobiaceae bacterium]